MNTLILVTAPNDSWKYETLNSTKIPAGVNILSLYNYHWLFPVGTTVHFWAQQMHNPHEKIWKSHVKNECKTILVFKYNDSWYFTQFMRSCHEFVMKYLIHSFSAFSISLSLKFKWRRFLIRVLTLVNHLII